MFERITNAQLRKSTLDQQVDRLKICEIVLKLIVLRKQVLGNGLDEGEADVIAEPDVAALSFQYDSLIDVIDDDFETHFDYR